MYLQDLETLSSVSTLISGFVKNIGGVKSALTSLSGTAVLPLTATLGTLYTVYKSVEFVQSWATGETAVLNYGKAIEQSKEKLQNISSSISDFENELENNRSKIAELQSAYNNGTITAAQKEELENLRLQNELIEQKLEKLNAAEKKEKSNAANSAKDQFNAEFGGDAAAQYDDFVKSYKNQFGTTNATGMIASIDTSSAVDQLNTIKYLTDEVQKAQVQLDQYHNGDSNLTETEASVLKEDIQYYTDALDIAKESFSNVSDDLYRHLQQQKSTLMADMNENGLFENDEGNAKADAYNNIKAWEEMYANYVDEYKEAAEKAEYEAAKAAGEAKKASPQPDLSKLEDNAKLVAQINSEIEKNGQLSSSSMSALLQSYPKLNAALEKYMGGLISEEQLFNELQSCYENDRTNYIKALVAKNNTDADFFNALKTNYPSLFNSLAEVYGNDVNNWKSLSEAKLQITNDLLNKMQTNWGHYFIAIGDQESGFELIRSSNFDDSDIYDHNMTEENWQNSDAYQQALNEYNRPADTYRQQAQHDVDSANDMLKQLNDASYNLVSSNIDATWQGLTGTRSSSGTTAEALEQFSEQIDWFERLTGRLSKMFNRFQNIFNNSGNDWHTRSDALSSAMSVINEQIKAQSEAYDDYMSRFNSFDLDSGYKDLIANGQIETETITDESLKNAIDACIQLYDNAQNCQDQLSELNNQLSDFAKQKFDNTADQFEAVLGKMNAVSTQLNNEAELLEAKGYTASSTLYKSLMEQEASTMEQLGKERQSLINALNEGMTSGTVKKYSEIWYSMQASIDEVTASLQNSKKTMVEYQNELRQLSWDLFDFTRENVTGLIDESEFLVDLLKKTGTTSENGMLNANGEAVQSLLVQKYELYLKQSEDYAAEIEKINQEIADDPYNTTLLEHRRELVKAQQDAILAAQDEKDAIKDLLSDSYSAYQEHLSKTIEKYKELMHSIKDAREYENTIAEKTKNLAALQKKYAAYEGDESEEGRKTVQLLKEQISEAENDLAQTEYEQLISDTERLLDNISAETEEYYNQRLDQIDVLLENIINQSADDAAAVSKTISDAAASAGYTLSSEMNRIWASGEEHRTALQNTIASIKEFTEKLLENSNKQAQNAVDEMNKQQDIQGAGSTGAGNADTGSSNESGSPDDSYEPGSEVDWIYSKDYYPKDRLNSETSIIDRLKWHDFDASFDARSQYYSQMGGEGTYYAAYAQNVWMLDWMKEHGYRLGTRNLHSPLNGFAWTQEDGPELIRTSDGAVLTPVGNGGTIFNSQMTDNLWRWGQINPLEIYSAMYALNEPIYQPSHLSGAGVISTVSGGIHISLPNVRNYEDFCQQAQKDPKFEKMIQAMTLEQALGKNSLNRLQF